ncbi:MAG: D,D-dipeptide ABC transporter permease, partial [Oligoflexia bacterium]|nr:D,D-dipeptide ABC transporter permease [Oligoflexia bacterium]
MKYFSIYFLCFIVVVAVLFPFLFDYDPYFIDLSQSFSKPSWFHPFGLDEDGKDLLIQVIYGLKMSLGIAFSVILLSFIIGLG